MMNFQDHVGQKLGPYRFPITAEKVREFSEATGATVLEDVPPTILTTLREGEFDWFQKLGLSLSQILHGEQGYTYLSPLEPGKEWIFHTELVKVLQKQGSRPMTFLYFETRVQDVATGKELAVTRSNMIFRGASK